MKIHIVQKGDTLWEISQKYNVDFEELKEMNAHLASPDMIMPGMKIRVPSSSKQNKKEVVITPKDESKTIPKQIESKKKIQVNESPKLQDDKAITLPELQGMDDFYSTTMFPESEEQPKPKGEKAEKPKDEYIQPTKEKPQYQSPIDYYYSPCTNLMPMHYCPCCYHQQAMIPNQMPPGCYGQQYQPMYAPTAYQQPTNQLYPVNNFTNFNRNDELDLFPRPPAMNSDKTDKKPDEGE